MPKCHLNISIEASRAFEVEDMLYYAVREVEAAMLKNEGLSWTCSDSSAIATISLTMPPMTKLERAACAKPLTFAPEDTT